MAELQTYFRSDSALGVDRNTWKPLRFLNIYRLLLSTLFVVLFNSTNKIPPLGQANPELFYYASLSYLVFSLLAMTAIGARRPSFNTQVYVHVGVDIIVLTALMHASGGIDSGVGMLLVVSVASASMLTEGRTAGLFAAVATLAILTEQVHAHVEGTERFISYPKAGMLGATIFATATLAHVLARRIRESEALAARRGLDLANMAKLTDYVIQHLSDGVIVVDDHHRIRLMNNAASELLRHRAKTHSDTLEEISPELARRLGRWQDGYIGEAELMEGADGEVELLTRFIRIGRPHTGGIVIFLEDATAATRQAQQLKLAALGRLTASIAHEIRNPLGAISHAGELLAESTHLDKADQRLTEIILQQSQRVNTIVQNVLKLGRRDRSRPQSILLQPWLGHFVEEFEQGDAIEYSTEPGDLAVWFDPSHLQQILWNLCKNAIHHGRTDDRKVQLEAYSTANGRPYLDVIDNGPGVAPEHRAQIFEPFFTTDSRGTGLGLYISRELAQCNGARLDYVDGQDGHGRFRISFAPAEPN